MANRFERVPLRRAIERHGWALVLVGSLLAGALLRAPVLESDFFADDYLQYAMLQGAYPVERAPWDLFRFADGTKEATQRLVDFGFYPWWTHPRFKLSMLRPLPSLLHAADYHLFGTDARLHHLHSFVWWGLMVIAVSLLFFSALPRVPASIALVLFALGSSHTAPLFWICNRSTLIATTFAAAGLWAHIAWRRGQRSGRGLSIGLFALALGSGEYAVAMFGYLVCFELLSPLERTSRLRALLPGAALCLGFVALAIALGYGTMHSGDYTSPFTEPLGYLHKLFYGLPVLLGDLILGSPADLWALDRRLQTHARLVASGLLGVALACALCYWLARRSDRAPWLGARWLAAGGALALLPVVGSFLTSRLVLPASIGLCALLGTAVTYAANAARARPLRWGLSATALITVVFYLDCYQAITMGRSALKVFGDLASGATAWPLFAEIDDARVSTQRIVLPASYDPNAAAFFPFVRSLHGHPLPKSFWLLSGARCAHALKRVDEHTLELTVLAQGDELHDSIVGSHTRAEADVLHLGDRVALHGLQIEVLAIEQAQPVRMRYRFEARLDDESLLFLQSTPIGWRRLVLPPPGQSITLPAPAFPVVKNLQRIVAPPAGYEARHAGG